MANAFSKTKFESHFTIDSMLIEVMVLEDILYNNDHCMLMPNDQFKGVLDDRMEYA